MSTQVDVILWLNAVLIALTFAAIASRVGRRVFVVGKFSWHDALITVAAVSATIFSILQMVCTRYGLGLHMADVDKSQVPHLVKLVMTSNVFYFLCNWAVKHALLLFYADITREKSHLVAIYIMHFVAFGFGLSSILAALFQCRPFNKAWRPDLPGYCINLNIFFYCNASIMLTTDLVLYIMPVVFTRKLQLRRPQKIGLNCLFALGGLVLASSAARMHSVHLFASKPDFTYRFANAMIWSVIENHLAIIVACAPSVKVIALLLFPKLTSSLRSFVSKASSSASRSRSRASVPYNLDLESGISDTKGSKSSRASRVSRVDKADKMRPTPNSTPLPSPALVIDSDSRGPSRASQGFAKWFKGPQSPIDSTEDHGLVDIKVQTDISVSSRDY